MQVTWTPAPCVPADCDDSNPCTTDTCVASVCHHDNVTNGTGCSDGIDCNGAETCVNGECTAGTPAVPPLQPESGGVDRNRYISFVVPDTNGAETAIRVTLTSLLHQNPADTDPNHQ